MICSTLYYWPIGQTVWLAYVTPAKAKIVQVEAKIFEDAEWLTYYVQILDAKHPLGHQIVPVTAKECFETRREAVARAKSLVPNEEGK